MDFKREGAESKVKKILLFLRGRNKVKPYQLLNLELPFKTVYKPHEYKLLRDGKIYCDCHCHPYHGSIGDKLIRGDDTCRCHTCPCWFLR